jgi:hypothetical protein
MDRKEYNKQYYQKNRKQQLEKATKYRNENKNKIKDWWVRSYPKKKDLYNGNRNKRHWDNLSVWKDFVFTKDRCEICGKKVYYNVKKNNGKTVGSVNFDHRKEECAIMGNPMNWLIKNYNRRNLEKEMIWKSCNFGILCTRCNRFLPTKNRKDFIEKLVKYVGI